MRTLNIRKMAIVMLTMIAVMFLSLIPASATSVDTTVVDTTTAGAQLGDTDLNNSNNPAGILPVKPEHPANV